MLEHGLRRNIGEMNVTNAVLGNIKTLTAIAIVIAKVAPQVNFKIKTDKVDVKVAVRVNIKIQMHKVDVKVAQLDSIKTKIKRLIASLAPREHTCTRI
jgi:hypothetical protein